MDGRKPVHLLQVYPSDCSFSTELVTNNVADVLNIVRRLHLEEAHVDCDGRYSFSVRCCGVGLWCIFQRDRSGGESDAIEVFG
jgi:hypothetical protein